MQQESSELSGQWVPSPGCFLLFGVVGGLFWVLHLTPDLLKDELMHINILGIYLSKT